MTFIVSFISLIFLLTLHELGHFLLAKKFGVRVEEFGLGYPPRITGKKIGETIYSVNLLPFGAFVRLSGEVGKSDDLRSFANQTVGKRILIALGGVLSFWMIAAILFTFVFYRGAPVVVEGESDVALEDLRIQIADVAPGSPAENANLGVGDTIKKMKTGSETIMPKDIKEIQDFTQLHLSDEITLTIERGEEIIDVSLFARSSPPEGEGAMGVALVKTAIQKYPWYSAPWQGILTTGKTTFYITQAYIYGIKSFFMREPTGIQLVGPVGVFQMLSRTQQLGTSYFLNFLALISINLAIFNLLPIPAVDGGKVLFLVIEALRKKPLPEGIEQKITASCFVILLILMIWVTINDVSRLL